MSKEDQDKNIDNPLESGGLVFPCDLTIKVIGKESPEFEPSIAQLIQKHFPQQALQLRPRTSRKGNYISLNIPLHFETRAQLEALYTELRQHPDVILVL